MQLKEDSRNIIIIVLAGLAALPLCFNSFGTDLDGWRMIMSGITLAEKGIYVPSRFPGYPVPELLFAGFAYTGTASILPYFSNIVVLLLSIATALIFCTLLKESGINNRLFPALSLLFTPVYLINATAPMDYNIALFFLTASVLFLIRQKYFISGILFGLAAASRFSSAPLFIVLLVYIPLYSRSHKLKSFSLLTGGILISLVPFFSLLFEKYGFGFLQFYDVPYPSVVNLIGRGTVKIWGIPGVLALLFIFVSIIPSLKNRLSEIEIRSKGILFVSASIILITAIQFLFIPNESGYLIPLIPFLILIAASYASVRQMQLFFVAVLISCLFTDIQNGTFTFSGPVVNNYFNRADDQARLEEISALQTAGNTAIIAGNTSVKLYIFNAQFKHRKNYSSGIFEIVNKNALDKIINDYRAVYCLPEARDEILEEHGYDVTGVSLKIKVYGAPI